jgi:hypothetical protein
VQDGFDSFPIFPRPSSFAGGITFHSAPLDVRAYSRGFLTAWQGTGLGTAPVATVAFTVQHSYDLEDWIDGAVLDPAADTEETAEVSCDKPWIRVKGVVSGATPGVTFWLVGRFLRRETGLPGEAA